MQKKPWKAVYDRVQAKVVKEVLCQEKTVEQLAAEYGVHTNMLYCWRDQALAGLPSLFNDRGQEPAKKERQMAKRVRRLVC